ncbi:MAG: YceD family protein [Acidobacteria bacterium]|nr:YceD family protein [Acidobacteriota bacterium]
MQIEVEKLTAEGESFAHKYAPGELLLDEEDIRLSTEATVVGCATRKRDEVRLRGTIKAGVEVACDRCLSAVAVPVEIEFDASFVPASVQSGAGENLELKPDDLRLDFYEGESLDIDSLVREQILLALPMQFLCREECKGLCPWCRADLNAGEHSCEHREVDPRWAALAELKREQD